MVEDLNILNTAVSVLIRAVLLAARFSGRVRQRYLRRLANGDIDARAKEIPFLKDRVHQLEMQVSLLQKQHTKKGKRRDSSGGGGPWSRGKVTGSNESLAVVSAGRGWGLSRILSQSSHWLMLPWWNTHTAVSLERIAKTLNVNVETIKRKRDLLIGICPEAVEILKNRKASAGAIRELKRVRPMRQIEMAEVMVASNNFTAAYAKCLVLASSPDQLLEPDQQAAPKGAEAHDIARLQREIGSMEHEFKLVQEEYGKNMLSLVVVIGYLRNLLDNAAIVRFLSQAEPAILAEFQKITDQADMKATG